MLSSASASFPCAVLFNEAAFTAINLIGLIAAVFIIVSFLYLSLRFEHKGGSRINLALGLSALLWSLGGIADAVLEIMGVGDDATVRFLVHGAEKCGGFFWMIPLLGLWKRHFRDRTTLAAIGILQTLIFLIGSFFLVSFVLAAFSPDTAWVPSRSLFRNAFLIAVPMMVIGLKVRNAGSCSPVDRFSLNLTLLGLAWILGTFLLITYVPLDETMVNMLKLATGIAPLFILTSSIVHFARFRLADCFIRNSLRAAAAATAGTVACLLVYHFPVSASGLESPSLGRSFLLFGLGLAVAVSLLGFVGLDRLFGRLLERRLFPALSNRTALEELRTTLGNLHEETALEESVCRTAERTLELFKVSVFRLTSEEAVAWADQLATGRAPPGKEARDWPPLPEAEWLLPVQLDHGCTRVLAVAPGRERRGLVTLEVDFLRDIALLLATRTEALRRERNFIAERQRETVLRQQLVEAELRALRAQVNPHFLFNSLNTIADLTITAPTRAETMTLRLAQVFRHVLIHSSRPLSSVGEEMDFLRSYLHIEEARFGERLVVDFDVDPRAAPLSIPSLLLQPLVENAIKHGLSPKPGVGHLRISAFAERGWLRLCVEDDGVGLRRAELGASEIMKFSALPASTGTGLNNILLRLEAFYRERAIFRIDPGAAGGCRAAVYIPLEMEDPS